jgi:hypothetical protein
VDSHTIKPIKGKLEVAMGNICMVQADKDNTICLNNGIITITTSSNSSSVPLQPQLTHVLAHKVQLHLMRRQLRPVNSTPRLQLQLPQPVRNLRRRRPLSLNISPTLNNIPECTRTGRTLTMPTKCTSNIMPDTHIIIKATKGCIKVRDTELPNMEVNKVVMTAFQIVIRLLGTILSVE